MKKTCEHCHWWAKVQPHTNDRTGHCRRNPPQIVPTVYTEPADENRGRYNDEVATSWSSAWPDTQSSDWCGEFHETAN